MVALVSKVPLAEPMRIQTATTTTVGTPLCDANSSAESDGPLSADIVSDPLFLPPGLCDSDSSDASAIPQVPFFTDINLISENARLAIENEMLRLQCAQVANCMAASTMYPQFGADFSYPAAPMQGHMASWRMPGKQAKSKTGERSNSPKSRARTMSSISQDGLRSRTWSALSQKESRTRTLSTLSHSDFAVPVQGPQTTLMLRNLPGNYSRDLLLDLLDRKGFAGRYDFLYLPIDFKSNASLGYAFINFLNQDQAEHFKDTFEGFTHWGMPSSKMASVDWSSPSQGLEAHIERFRNSPVMHETVPEEHKPVLYVKGMRTTFPVPTKKLRAPRVRPGRRSGQLE